jgi:transglutaminase-like putative cysteine protease
MRYRIRHITEYQYQEEVTHCYNLAQMIPRNTLRQNCIRSDITVSPYTAFNAQRQDYFGNQCFHFEIQQPHQNLLITSTTEVETSPQAFSGSRLDFGISCLDARQLLASSTEAEVLVAREFILNSPMAKISDELRNYASPSFADDRPLLSSVMDLTSRIYNEFNYSPEATTVATPLAEVLANKAGVCQDFAHLQIACLRAMGFPAKYVSGYIETLPPPGQEKMVGADATHAWISVFSPTEGWVEFDPTNNCIAGDQHIITAWGRDYGDVAPLKGIIFGGGEEPKLNVSVDVTRL